MVTRRGWMVASSSLVLVIFGRALGVTELFGLAVACVVLVVVARVYVARRQGELAVTARAAPAIARVDEPARLEVRVQNRGSTRSRSVLLRQAAHRGKHTPITLGDVVVPPLPPSEEGRIVVPVATARRGAFELSGISVDLEDPLGLACRRARTLCEAHLVVLPRMEQLDDVAPFNSFAGRDEAIRSTASRLGSGLSSVRQYAEGDDLRLVHWKTSARVGELMVREGGDPESPQSRSVTVVLDCRRSPHTPETFETAVTTAASVLDTSAALGAAVRLVTTGGVDTGFGEDDHHLESALIELAVVETRSESMSRALSVGADSDDGSGLLVVVTTSRAKERDIETLLLAISSRNPVLVLVSDTPGELPIEFAHYVEIPAGSSVRAAWVDAFGLAEIGPTDPSAWSQPAVSVSRHT